MVRYGQYCPIAKALELLGERWTLLVVRELLMGSGRFNDLRRGVPLMAPSVLSERLKSLTEHGLIVREKMPDASSYEYHLTAAAEELRPLIMQLGNWGQRWSRSKMAADDLDASFLMWDIRRCVHIDKLPEVPAVVFFEFADAKKGMKHWWLVAQEGDVELCLEDPGHEVDVTINTSLRTMTQIWMGDCSLSQARAKGLVKLLGTTQWVRSIGDWLGPSPFAHVRPAATSATVGG
jgi:DNA-binding HxlR family transcriptional regulator